MNSIRRRDVLHAALTAAGAATLGVWSAPWRAVAEERKLAITAVEPYVLRGGRCFVLVRTSEGVTGIGEVSPMNAPTAAHLISGAFSKLLIGMNALDVERCWDRVYYATYKQGVMGLQPEALAGVDIALWDIRGKVVGMPVHQLLGGKRRDSVRMYASIGGGATATPKQMADRAERAVAQGFTAVKIRMDYGPVVPDANVSHDLETLATVRKAIGDKIELKYDANNGYSVQTAIRVGKAIEAYNVIHLYVLFSALLVCTTGVAAIFFLVLFLLWAWWITLPLGAWRYSSCVAACEDRTRGGGEWLTGPSRSPFRRSTPPLVRVVHRYECRTLSWALEEPA